MGSTDNRLKSYPESGSLDAIIEGWRERNRRGILDMDRRAFFYRSECKCSCHNPTTDSVCLHMIPCCIPDPVFNGTVSKAFEEASDIESETPITSGRLAPEPDRPYTRKLIEELYRFWANEQAGRSKRYAICNSEQVGKIISEWPEVICVKPDEE